MKLSFSNCAARDQVNGGNVDWAGAFQMIRACGFTHTDFYVSPEELEGDFRQNALRTRAMIDESGLTLAMGHAPMCNFRVIGKEEATRIHSDAFIYCKHAGIPMMVVHPGAADGDDRDTFFRENVDMYRRLIPIAEETGVRVLIENIGNYADPYYLWNGKDLREMIDRVDHPLFLACWDVGHANHFFPEHCDQYESVVALGDKLAALHVHDNAGYFEDPRKHYRIDMHAHPYFSSMACVNYDALLQGLVDIGYKGDFNFEAVAPARDGMRPTFTYKGEVVHKLELPSAAVWQAYNTALYAVGRFMLETYGVFEG